jgi:hypothetical protein
VDVPRTFCFFCWWLFGVMLRPWALVAATAGTMLLVATLVSQLPEQSEVIVNIYEPKGALSPALERLRPVKSRLQALTGCECVDISKVPPASCSPLLCPARGCAARMSALQS